MTKDEETTVDTSVHTISVGSTDEGSKPGEAARRALSDGLRSARRSGARVVVLDVHEGAWAWKWDGRALSAKDIALQLHSGVLELLAVGLPVVARLSGEVSGHGLALALACDLRFADAEIQLSVGAPGGIEPLLTGLPWLLRDRLGTARAQDWLMTGRTVDTATATAWGLVSTADPVRTVATLARTPAVVTSALTRAMTGRSVAEYRKHLDYESWLGAVASRSDARG